MNKNYVLLLFLIVLSAKPTTNAPATADAPTTIESPDLTPTILYSATVVADNAADFGVVNIEASTTPAVPLEIPPVDNSIAQITPEESAARIAQAAQAQKDALAEETKKEEEKTTEAKKNADLFSYNLTGMKEAGIDISKNGFGITAKLTLLGKPCRVTFTVDASGFYAQVYLKEIEVGPLLKLTGTGPDGKYGTADDGVFFEIKMDKDVQKIRYSGLAEILGVMAATDITLGVDENSLYARASLFNIFETVFFAGFKITDPDFLLFAAIESKLMKYITDAAVAAFSGTFDALVSVTKKAQKEISQAQADLNKLKHTMNQQQIDLDKAQKNYFNNLNKAQKEVDSAVHAVENANSNLAGSLKKILQARDDVFTRRKKLDSAISQVNSLNDEVNQAKRTVRKIAKGMKWYEFWKTAELAYWSVRLSAVEVARGIAVAALKIAKAAIAVTAGLITGVYGVAYAGGEVALKLAYGILEASLVAANPLTIDEFGKVLECSLLLNGTKTAFYTAQASLITSSGMLEAIKQVSKGVSIAGSELIKTTLGLFTIDGGGFKSTLSDIKKGYLDLYIMATVFGVRKSLKLVLDMNRPEKTLASIGIMIADLFNPTAHGGNGMMSELENARKKFTGELDAIEAKKAAAEKEKNDLLKKQQDREAALKKLNAEHQQRLAAMRETFPLTAQDIQNMGDMSFITGDQILSIVDEKQPTSYTIGNMNNTFRWLEQWKLPAPQNGSVLFDVAGDDEINIAFHNTVNEKEQKTNKLCDVLLGTQNNSCSVIRGSDNKVLFTTGDSANLLQTGKNGALQSYWVSLNNNCIAVGRGRKPGESLLFDWMIPSLPADTAYFSFSCGKNRLSIVNIESGPASSKPFGSQYSSFNGFNIFSWPFKLPAINNGTILFKAKASEHLAIGFTDNPETKFPRYLAVLGNENNSKTTLATTSPNGKLYNYAAISEDPDATLPKTANYLPYWITFDNGSITLGTGIDPTKNIILEAKVDAGTLSPSVIEPEATTPPPTPTGSTTVTTAPPLRAGSPCSIQYFSFNSWDSPVEIRDITISPAVPVSPGTKFSAVNKNYLCTWKDHWLLPAPGKGIITWQGKGNNDMAVALHTNATSNDETYTYLCIIGAEKNSSTVLMDQTQKVLTKNNDLLATVRTKKTYTDYWLSYDNGTIMAGVGTEPGKKCTLEYTGENKPITHFSFTNKNGYTEFAGITSKPIIQSFAGGVQHTCMPHSPLFYHPTWTALDDNGLSLRCMLKMNDGCIIGFKDEAGTEYTFTIDKDTKGAAVLTDPSNFYPYWLTYQQSTGILSFGMGTTPGKGTVDTKTFDTKPIIKQYGVGNDTDFPVYIKKLKAYNAQNPVPLDAYSSQEGYIASAASDAQPNWQESWKLPTSDSATITLSTRTQSAASIVLGNPDNGIMYEYYLSSSEAVIKKKGAIVARTTNPDALLQSPETLQEYYLNYYKGHLVLATGKNLKTDIVLEWYDEAAEKNITHASFKGQGTIFENIVILPGSKLPLYQVYSSCSERGVFKWLTPWVLAKPEKGSISFELKTDAEAIIGFSSTKDAIYTITLGATTTITKQGVVVASDGGSALEKDPSTYNPYWIIFDKGYIAVGSGYQPSVESVLVEYQGIVTADIIQRFSLSSTTGQATYRAITVNSITGTQVKRNTNCSAAAQKKNYTFSDRWSLVEPSKTSLTFDVQGEGPYYIGFDNKISSAVTNPEYEVILGAEKNTISQIRKKGIVVATATTTPALIASSELTASYWITFNQGRISVGSGSKPGANTFMDWIDATVVDIPFFSFSSDLSVVRYKKITPMPAVKQEKTTNYVVPASLGKYKFDPEWALPSPDFGGVHVVAQGKSDICIGLHSGTSGQPIYEVIIGADNNTHTIIKSNGTIVASLDNPEALIKNEFIPTAYWILYDHKTIVVGSDETPGKNILLLWHDDSITTTKNIMYYGFSSTINMVTLKNITSIPGLVFSPTQTYSCYNKQSAFDWKPEWKIKAGETITFDLTAPKGEACIGFNTLTNGSARLSIMLGGWQNTKSASFKNNQIQEKYDFTLKPITKKIWITYEPESISVGTGDPHSKELFTWNLPEITDSINFFSLSSGTTGVLYENIKVIKSESIKRPKVAPTVKAIEIAPAPAEPVITDPTNPAYLPPAVAALLKQNATEPTPPPAPLPAAPIDSMTFLKTISDDAVTVVAPISDERLAEVIGAAPEPPAQTAIVAAPAA